MYVKIRARYINKQTAKSIYKPKNLGGTQTGEQMDTQTAR